MKERKQSQSNTALADCARWAVHALAAELRNPGNNTANIAEHIIFAARAMQAYKTELDGIIPEDFLEHAIQADSFDQPVILDVASLLAGASIVTTLGGEGERKQEAEAISRKLGDWLSSACLRSSKMSAPDLLPFESALIG